jgi:hypothetical protein
MEAECEAYRQAMRRWLDKRRGVKLNAKGWSRNDSS